MLLLLLSLKSFKSFKSFTWRYWLKSLYINFFFRNHLSQSSRLIMRYIRISPSSFITVMLICMLSFYSKECDGYLIWYNNNNIFTIKRKWCFISFHDDRKKIRSGGAVWVSSAVEIYIYFFLKSRSPRETCGLVILVTWLFSSLVDLSSREINLYKNYIFYRWHDSRQKNNGNLNSSQQKVCMYLFIYIKKYIWLHFASHFAS